MFGNIYLSPATWGTGKVIFTVIRQITDKQRLDIKLLNKPNYYSFALGKRGYAQIRLKSLNDCKIITDKYNITEIIEMLILPNIME